MKSLNSSFLCLVALSYLLLACSTKKQDDERGNPSLLTPKLELTVRPATVILPLQNLNDTTGTGGRSKIRYPLEYEKAEVNIIGNTLHLTFPIQWPDYVILRWKNRRQRLFLIPGDTLNISEQDGEYRYEGKSASINRYLRAKEKALGKMEFNLPKGMLMSTVRNLDSLGAKVDALSKKEIDFLQAQAKAHKLPDWYINFEDNDIRYFGAVVKLSAPEYRASLLDLEERPSADYYSFLDSLPVYNPQAAHSAYYYEFLYQLTRYYYLTDSLKSKKARERSPIILANSFQFFDKELKNPIKEFMLMQVISQAIVGNYPLQDEFIQSAINRLKDTTHQALMREIKANHEQSIMPKGTRAPIFILPDEAGNPVNLKEFRGRIVLLSFWATWCKPCLKEIPYENQLIDSFEGEQFALVSICMGSSKTAWKARLKKYQLKAHNLYANEKWQDNINGQYKIHGLPDYTLLDAEGRVIEYKTDRPSDDSLRIKISKALQELQSEATQ